MSKTVPTTGPDGVVALSLGTPGRKGSKIVKVAPATGHLKIGQQKRLAPAAQVFASVTKGEARKVRKLLRASGFPALAAVRRAA